MIRIFTPKVFDPAFTINCWIVQDGQVRTHYRNGCQGASKYMSVAELEIGVRDGRFVEVAGEPEATDNYRRSYFDKSL